jgi:RNA polymerase sigma-54 factor
MKPGLSLRFSQHLALTPQLQQSIRLLQLSTLELSQEVEHMLDQNPFLELSDETAPREDFGLSQADAPIVPGERIQDMAGEFAERSSPQDAAPTTADEAEATLDGVAEGWDGDGSVDMAADDSEWGTDAPARANATPDRDHSPSAIELAGSQTSLTAHLHQQALALRLNEVEREALHFLIESLNEDGYLEDSLETLARHLAGEHTAHMEALLQEFSVALRWLQAMQPTGVGARHLSECLTLQLQALRDQPEVDPEVREVALQICRQPMEWLARRDMRHLLPACQTREATLREAMNLIARLEPKPGRPFVQVERHIVIPDVLVSRIGSGTQARYRVQLNPDVMPRLRVYDVYAQAIKGGRGREACGASHPAMQQHLQEARWFIKNIQQRFDTILRVSQAIVERQKNFFTHGEIAMRPLVLREIADELGLHESTISRVTTAKYMATPQGTFELKHFFGSSLGTEAGGNASSTAVRALIRQLIAGENQRKPLSDNQLSLMLREQGIECARRTVAKYREALKIAPAKLRKAL